MADNELAQDGAQAAPELNEQQQGDSYFYASESAEADAEDKGIGGSLEDIDMLETANFSSLSEESLANLEAQTPEVTGAHSIVPNTPQDEPAEADESESQADQAPADAPQAAGLTEEEMALQNTGAQAALDALDNPVDAPEDEEPSVPAAAIGVIEPDEETSGKKKRRKRKASHIILNILAVLVGACAIAALGFVGWLYWDDIQHQQIVPSKTTLDGEVNISGLSRDEVSEIVQKRADLGYSSEVDLQVADKVHVIELTDVGKINVDATVDQAFEYYKNTDFVARAVKRVKGMMGEQTDEQISIATVCDIADNKLKKRVNEIAKEDDCDAEDAGYVYSKGKLVTTKAKTGIKVNKEKTLKSIQEKLVGSTGTIQVKASAKITKPDVTKPGQAIYIDTSDCKLYLYEGGKVKITWDCSPGQSGYPTPTGDWYLEYKDAAPTWINPHSDWSANMPETIGPGASNPLGLRALAVSCGGGIFIHGTTNYGALGSRDSHGCIRLANENIVKLYDRVSVGIPIIIR